ncbi:hypothetical protein Cgig2_033905 [Carnegiea gigantea]|uniref:Endonuclease/exonuclease/phosphatase domain-containing protein n=1 Tax=Carnegiea gigantea TaxID=171969 RepID=A0A9Q1GLV0_9CARY|nr:hypothetical protein Cgig2_033905 [Carnegiea gigantea]
MYGHAEETCKKKDPTRKEWRVKRPMEHGVHPNASPPDPTFSSSLRHSSIELEANIPRQQAIVSPRMKNSFQVLVEDGARPEINHPPLTLMDNISAWNVKSLNWPNKQVDVHLFLHDNKVGLVGLLETKVKEVKANSVLQTFSRDADGWITSPKPSRIWVAWKPSCYNVKLVALSDQFIHCHTMRMSTNDQFYITFIYGQNQVHLQYQLWEDLASLQPGHVPWCIIGDFNAIIYKDDRVGRGDVLASDIKDMRDFMDLCELHKMRNIGPYFSWSNKTVMSRINRALINDSWYGLFDYIQV